MQKITVKLNIEKDAWNWWDACNKISHGVDWKMNINSDLRNKIYQKSQKEAYDFLVPYLKNLYGNLNINKYIKEIQKGFDLKKEKIFERMEKVTGHPIYRNNFTCFITSFPRFPYNYEKGYIWISNRKPLDFQLQIFIHELLHFQYFAYFGEKIWKELGPKKHSEIKEAMTIILNDEFRDLILTKDEGYEEYKSLSLKLLKIWRKTKNMDKFINEAIKTFATKGCVVDAKFKGGKIKGKGDLII